MTGVGTISVQDVPGQVIAEAAARVVALHGDIDLATPDLLEDCLIAGVERGGDVFDDLAGATRIHGASLGVLIQAGRFAERRGQTVHLMAPPSFVRRILAVAEIGETLPVVDVALTLPAAWAATRRRSCHRSDRRRVIGMRSRGQRSTRIMGARIHDLRCGCAARRWR